MHNYTLTLTLNKTKPHPEFNVYNYALTLIKSETTMYQKLQYIRNYNVSETTVYQKLQCIRGHNIIENDPNIHTYKTTADP